MAIVSMLYGAGGASSADEVSCTFGGQQTNVQDALDILGEIGSTQTVASTTTKSIGEADAIKFATIVLNKGKYLIQARVSGMKPTDGFASVYLTSTIFPDTYLYWRDYFNSYMLCDKFTIADVVEDNTEINIEVGWVQGGTLTVNAGGATITAIKIAEMSNL